MKKNIVCKRIRQLRLIRGISQEYMAEELSLIQPSYARLEAEDSRINIERLMKIARVLEVELTDLFSEEPITYKKDPAINKAKTDSIREVINIDLQYIEFLKDEIKFLRELLKSKTSN